MQKTWFLKFEWVRKLDNLKNEFYNYYYYLRNSSLNGSFHTRRRTAEWGNYYSTFLVVGATSFVFIIRRRHIILTFFRFLYENGRKKPNSGSRRFSETFLKTGHFRNSTSRYCTEWTDYGSLHPNKVIAMAIVRCQLGKNYLES